MQHRKNKAVKRPEKGLDRLVGETLGRLAKLPRKTKRLVMLAADTVAVPACALIGIWLTHPAGQSWPAWLWVVPLLVCLPMFRATGLYRAIVRFMGLDLTVAALKSVGIGSVAFLLALAWVEGWSVAAHGATAFWFVAMVYVVGSRLTVQWLLQGRRQRGDRVLIYGAGDAGARLLSAISGGEQFLPMGFIDDNPAIQGAAVGGIEVHGPVRLPSLIEDLDISRVLLALPSAPRRRRREIIQSLEMLPVHVQTMPDFSDLISGAARVDDIREVDITDLLGRDPVPPVSSLLGACVRGKSVLVTGAGGSIGAELCLQIARLGVQTLVLLDFSEAALYTIHRRLRELIARDGLDLQLVPLIGSVHHKERIRELLEAYRVETVYHAAAYKHVPLVEHNMIEGIHNNVFGTLHAAQAALEAGVRSFVLISTDKAVAPTNVMGATKRFAELVLQGLNQRSSVTVFSMVRFGNVLASSGSVVPLFREQIRHGGPVTVTHPEIYRYFMTIPEAASLVIQAGSMARGGDVFVLDMGEPVRIRDLAERMIHLMGLTVRDEHHPDGDIEIRYTGLRPAEKLYEELLIGNNVMGTEHPGIMRAEEEFLHWESLQPLLAHLWDACRERDCAKARQLLLTDVTGYAPTADLEDLVWTERSRMKKAAVSNVTPIQIKRPPSGQQGPN
jgi:FlaA1/EpsC-like NDP-sugar epimerase